MDGVPCDDMLIDTGASCSFIRRSWAMAAGLPIVPQQRSMTVTFADERTAASEHRVLVRRMDVYGSAAADELLVMDELSNDVIVGLEWQRDSGLVTTPSRPYDLLNGQPVLPRQPKKKAAAQPRKLAARVPSGAPRQNTVTVRAAAAPAQAADAVRPQSTGTRAAAAAGRPAGLNPAASAQGSEALQRVLAKHQLVFTEKLPIKTAAQIAASMQFRVELRGGDVRPVKQRERRHSPAEIAAATEWVRDEVAAGRMESSSGEWAAQLVIVAKKNDKGEVSGWRVCGDYRDLNAATKADAEPLPLMQAVFDQLSSMQYFSKLDLLKGFNQIPVEPASRELMAVSTPAGLYQPTVMPFGVKNAPGAFQREMRRVLGPRLNKGVAVYIDDVIVYSHTEAEQLELIDWVLARLAAAGYYAHPGKCEFVRREVSFLGHIVSHHGVSMQQHKVAAVRAWKVPVNVTEVRSFLGLANFYRRFVQGYAEIARPLTDLTRKAEDGEPSFTWGPEAQRAFDELKRRVASAPVLAHPDPQRPWVINADASKHALGAVLQQPQDDGTLRPVAYWSYKLKAAERNYSATELELMALVLSTKEWRVYLHGSPHDIQLLSDHKPLMYLNGKEQLNQRLTNWNEQLGDYTFVVSYVPGKDNVVADALSRRADHAELKDGEANDEPRRKVRLTAARLTAAQTGRWGMWSFGGHWMDPPPSVSLATTRARAKAGQPAVQASSDERRTAQYEYTLHVDSMLGDLRAAAARDAEYQALLQGRVEHDGYERRDGLVYSRSGAVCVPKDQALRSRLMMLAHDAAGHFGRDKTIERLGRHCWWVGLSSDVMDFVRGCPVCDAQRASNDLPAGLLQPLSVPADVWDSVSVDFVGPLPMSKDGYDSILVLIDRLSKMMLLRPCTTSITAIETGRLLLDMMLPMGKLPKSIVSDRDVRFTSAAWGQLWKGLGTKLAMSTAYHPQSDGQTERMNRTMQTMLRSYVEKREDWTEWLPFVAAAYNSTRQDSTRRTPFELNFADGRAVDPLQWALRQGQPAGGDVPVGAGDPRGVSVAAQRTLDEMKLIKEEVRQQLLRAQERQKKYADRKRRDVKYEVGSSVWLSTENLRTLQGKLTPKWVGPYVVRKVRADGLAVELDLRGELGRTHPTFHVSLVKPYVESQLEWPGRDRRNRPAPQLVDGETEWEVERVIGKRVTYETVEKVVEVEAPPRRAGMRSRKPQTRTVKEQVPVVWYMVRWKGYDDDLASWKREADLVHSREAIDEYELLMRQLDEERAADGKGTAVELGVATAMHWRLQDRRSTMRRGSPTVRCSYARATVQAAEREAAACSSAPRPASVKAAARAAAGSGTAACGGVAARPAVACGAAAAKPAASVPAVCGVAQRASVGAAAVCGAVQRPAVLGASATCGAVQAGVVRGAWIRPCEVGVRCVPDGRGQMQPSAEASRARPKSLSQSR